MAYGSVQLVPGVNIERTPTLNQAGYSATAMIRYRDGLAEKLGGYVLFVSGVSAGIPRALHAWRDLDGVERLAEGTTAELNIITTAGLFTNITPNTLLSDVAPSFSTTLGSSLVQVDDANGPNPVTIYDSVFLNTPVSIGGLVLSGLYPIVDVAGVTSYIIDAVVNATATVAAAGTLPIFTTTALLSTVNVNMVAHGLAVNDQIIFQISTMVGGLNILGTYQVFAVVDADNFQIIAANQAASNDTVTMNVGLAEFNYYITPGPPPLGTGYGFGGYGSGGYGGSPIVGPGIQGTPITVTDWSLANWGQVLLACPKGGGIYAYNPTTGLRLAQLVGGAAPFNGGIIIAMAEQILIAWGSCPLNPKIGAVFDPLLIKWSDGGDYTNWAINSDTQAGDFRLTSGNAIIGAMQVSHQSMFWTDIDLWQASYIQPPLVFGFNKIAAGCGLIGQHAIAELRGAVYWMSPNNFWVLAGQGVEVLKCSVWDAVFQDLDAANQSKCWAWPNSSYNEVWFFYPSKSGATGECDKYVKFNLLEQAWDFGPLKRSAGIDQTILGPPIAASPDSRLYQHEVGVDAAGQILPWSFTTGYFYLAEGEEYAFVDRVIPDFKYGYFNGAQNATVSILLNTVNYPGDTPRIYGPFTFNSTTQYIPCRVRARQMSLTVSGNDLGSFARLGKVRYRYAPDGRR